MAKHLNVELNFSANTRQAQQQLKSLQSQMDALFTNMGKSELPVTKNLFEAQSAAAGLQVALNQAINQDTGKLDLSKFSSSLKKSNLDMQTLSKQMNRLGPDGQAAFMSLTQSILSAETATRRTNALIKEMWTTMKNTARWQISSSIMHGFQSTLQSAMGYAQDLDKSLNNIRIVTGQNVDQMAKFAENANKAAKALSTTTTKYTDAALIYYQQGLTDKEVLDRTNVTVKMANVAGQTAEVVSDQMTAVWNNFYDGSKSLEYYADVMTALGAATASSTDEISTGLNKFAAVSNTVGLSYEYAASALATVTATTRQSADIVGTAFRTLFTRIQGLSLGETLDDGVTLNKYSEALNAVGVNIMDQFGQLKDMDIILDELGSKWQNISKEQQVGLAQTIGGARQYATLIALMDNWSFFQENLTTSFGAEGELEKQADIYAESWEAAKKRTKSALQGIYDSLLDENLFIDIADSLTVVYDGIENIIDSMGGLVGVVSLLGTVFTKVFSVQLQKNLENLGHNFLNFVGVNQKNAQKLQNDAYSIAMNMHSNTGTAAGDAQVKVMKSQIELQRELEKVSSKITEEERERLELLLQIHKTTAESYIQAHARVDKTGDIKGSSLFNLREASINSIGDDSRLKQINKFVNSENTGATKIANRGAEAQSLSQQMIERFTKKHSKYGISDDFNKDSEKFGKLIKNIDQQSSEEFNKILNNFNKSNRTKKDSTELVNFLKKLEKEQAIELKTKSRLNEGYSHTAFNQKFKNLDKDNQKAVKESAQATWDHAVATNKLTEAEKQRELQTKKTIEAIQKSKEVSQSFSNAIVTAAQGTTRLIFGLSSLKSAFQTLKNDDLSFFDKLSSVSMSLSIGIPSLVAGLTSLHGAYTVLVGLKAKHNAESTKELANTIALGLAAKLGIVTEKGQVTTKWEHVIAQEALNKAQSKGLFLMGKMALVFAGVVAVAAALIYVFKEIKENTPDAKIAKANEELDKMRSATAAVRSEMSSLISTINGFESSRLQIANMEKGTVEWLEASMKLHEEVKGIAEEYGLIASTDLIKNEDGFYTGLNTEGQEKLNKQIEERLWNSQLMLISSEQRNKEILAEQKKQLLYKEGFSGGKTSADYGDANTNLNYLYFKENENWDWQNEGLINAWEFKSLNTTEAELDSIINKIASGEILIGENWDALNKLNEDDPAKAILEFAAANEEFAETLKTAIDSQKEYNNSLIDTTIAQQLLNKEQAYDKDKGWVAEYQTWEGLTEPGKNYVDDVIAEKLDDATNAILADPNFKPSNEQYEEYLKSIGYKKDGAGQWTDANGNSVDYNKIISENKEDLNRSIAYQQAIDSYDIEANREETIKEANAKGAGHIYTNEALNVNELNRSMEIAGGLDEEANKEYLANKDYLITETLKKDADYQKALAGNTKEAKEEADKIEAKYEKIFSRIAARNANFNVGFKDIIENYKDYYDILQDTENIDYPAYLDKMRDSFSKMMDIDGKFLSEAFLTSKDTLDLMKRAAEGDFEALNQLSINTAKSIIENANITDQSILSSLNNAIAAFDTSEYKIGMSLEDGPFLEALNTALKAGAMTAEQVQAVLNSMHFEPEITYKEIETQSLMIGQQAYVEDGERPGEFKLVTVDESNINTSTFHLPMVNAEGTKYSGAPAGKINTSNVSAAKSNGSSARSKQKKASDEIDRYHEIKEVIEDLNREMDRLGKAKDRAWGKSKLDLIDQEIDKVEEAIAAQKEYLDQISANIGPDQSAIAAYGAIFDEMGRITNYEELIQSQINKYNSMVASGDEDAAEEQYEKFKKALEQYEETADLYEDEWEKLVDLQNEFYDKLLEKVEYTVELNIEISDTKLKYLDYLLERLGDDAYKTSEAITELFSNLTEQTEQAFKRIDTYQEGIEAIFANHGANAQDWINGSMSNEQLIALGFTEAEIEALIKYQEGLIEENKSLLEIKDDIINQITESFNGFNEEMQEGIDKINHLKNVMNSFKNIVDLVGKQRLGVSDETIANMNNALVNMSIDALASNRTRVESLKSALDELQTRINNETNEEIKADMQKTFDEMQKEYEAATEDMLGTWEETLQQINDVFNEAVDTALTNFERRMAAGYGSLDALLTASDRAKTIDEQYLSDYRQIYELSKLTRDINNSIDNTDNLQGKRELKELLNEINEIQNQGVQMSAYDLEYLQKKYDLRLAEIALEDAQNAKNQVRMTRDADGNWSYTYTADESAVDGAAQNYEDKLYALQELSNNYLNQISEQWIQAEKEWAAALASIYQDATLSEEERQVQIDATNEFYKERFEYFTSEIEKATGNNKVLYEEDWRAYLDKTEQQIASNEDFQTSFNDTVLGTLYDGFDTVKELQNELNAAIGGPGEDGTLLGDLSIAYADWSARVDEAMDTAGIAIEDFDETMDKVADDTEAASEQMADSVEGTADRMSDAFGTLLDNVDSWLDAYRDKIGNAIEQNELLAGSVIALMEVLGAEGSSTSYNPRRIGNGGGGGSTGGNGGNENKTTTTVVPRGYKSTLLQNAGVIPYEFNNKSEAIKATKAFWVSNTDMSDYINGLSPSEYFDKYLAEKYIEPFKTGGYTGEWGSGGKLAMLHEKELVLHEGDTENFLTAIDMIREITRVIDLNTLGSLMGLGVLKEAQTITDSNQIIEQEVTIHAEFPNATNHNEIEEAFNNLINTASQYANRKKI